MTVVAVLPKPYNVLGLQSGKSITINVDSFVTGELQTDDSARNPNRLWPMARIYGRSTDPSDTRSYFDITSRMLLASLVPFLSAAGAYGRTVQITAYGIQYKKRFSWRTL